jgi:hypothetical protein
MMCPILRSSTIFDAPKVTTPEGSAGVARQEVVHDPRLVVQGLLDRVEVRSEPRHRELVACGPHPAKAAQIRIALDDVVAHEGVRSHRGRR